MLSPTMSSEQSIWYRLGYALERARASAPAGARKLSPLRERRAVAREPAEADRPERSAGAEDLLASAAMVALGKVLDSWRPRRRSGPVALLKAGASGAAAALLVELIRPLLRGEAGGPTLTDDAVDRLLAGAGQGLVYGAVVEPRLPGHAIVKGALYGSAEYAVHPMGGLYKALGAKAPLRRIPGVGSLLGELEPHERLYLEHVTFGIALALLYGSEPGPRSNGIVGAEDE